MRFANLLLTNLQTTKCKREGCRKYGRASVCAHVLRFPDIFNHHHAIMQDGFCTDECVAIHAQRALELMFAGEAGQGGDKPQPEKRKREQDEDASVKPKVAKKAPVCSHIADSDTPDMLTHLTRQLSRRRPPAASDRAL